MTDKKDDYYQPWLRGPEPAPDRRPEPAADEGLARPDPDMPPGFDSRPRTARPTREAPARADQMKAGAQGAWQAVRRGAGAFADWTIDLGERADIPARVEAMEIPRRSRELARQGGALSARAARAIGRGAATTGRAAARASGAAWSRLALGDRMARLSSGAGKGLEEVASRTRSGIGQVAKAGKDSVSDAASKLRPASHEDMSPPPSGLEQLLAREEAETARTRASAPDLPLFAGEVAAEAIAEQNPVAEDDRTPHLPPARPRAPARTKAMSAAAAPGISGNAVALSPRHWTIGGLALLALLGASFWLGGRFGGGLSKGEVETIVADYIRANPQIIPQALEAQRDREVAKAIDAIRPALEKPYAGAWAGNADGDVTLVVFTDYACGFCRASLPDIDRLVREDKRLKVVFRELPIISPQSRDAAIMALAAARQGKYDAFHHAMFAASSLDPSAIAAAAEKAGVVTDGSADATANEALFQRELDSNLAIATQLQLNATPTWVIGDQLFQGQVGYDTLRRAIAKARSKG